MTESELAAVLRGLVPTLREMVTKAVQTQLTAVHDRLVTIERGLGDDLLIAVERRLGDDVVTKEMGQLRERMTGLETRTLEPGPPGAPGPPGRDGLGFEDLEAVQVDERTIELRARQGEHVKALGRFCFPIDLYCGVYVVGKQYSPGDNVTHQGSVWHCNKETRQAPGELGNGSGAWTLKVKRGRDAKGYDRV